MTVDKAATRLGISPRTVRRLIRWGELPLIGSSSTIRVSDSAVEHLAQAFDQLRGVVEPPGDSNQ